MRRSDPRAWFALALALACSVGEDLHGASPPWSRPGGDETDQDIDVDPHGSGSSSSGGEGSTMSPPPPPTDGDADTTTDDDATSSGEMPVISTDASSEASSDDGDPPPPGEEPLWEGCNEDLDCEDSLCFLLVDGETMDLLSGYCSRPCESPEDDCPPAPTGDAMPSCLSSDAGESLCALDCSLGQTCPKDMSCTQLTDAAWYCF